MKTGIDALCGEDLFHTTFKRSFHPNNEDTHTSYRYLTYVISVNLLLNGEVRPV